MDQLKSVPTLILLLPLTSVIVRIHFRLLLLLLLLDGRR